MNRITFTALLLVTACTAEPRNQTAADSAAPAIPERPASIADTLLIEGMAEPVQLQLFETPAEFPLQFSTYLPAGISARPFTADLDTASVRFSARFTPDTDPNVYMHLLVYPPDEPLIELEEMVLSFIESREPLDREYARIDPPAWAEDAWSFRYGSGDRRYVGSIAFGEHAGRPFSIIVHYPPEYGDGFPPRVRLILDQWRWENDGTMLVGSMP